MKDKLRSSVRGASKGEEISQEILNYTSSVIDPETSEALSEKISSMMPDIGIIKATGLIKKTDSFQESKDILTNFKTALYNLSEDALKEHDYNYEKSDGRKALDRATDELHMVINFMIRAGIEVPQIYRDFLFTVRPPAAIPQEVQIETKPPLFKITGVDEHGEVKVETDTPLVLKKGNTEIALTNEKLTETLINSQKVDCKMVRDMHDWVKNNLHRAGSLEKIDDSEWKKLRQSIVDNYNHHKPIETNGEEYNVSVDDIDDIIKELEEEGEEEVIPKPIEEVKIQPQKVQIDVPKSVNLNAYEIRLSVLQEALEWVKHNKNTNKTEDVIDVANRFYKFVEQNNRR